MLLFILVFQFQPTYIPILTIQGENIAKKKNQKKKKESKSMYNYSKWKEYLVSGLP